MSDKVGNHNPNLDSVDKELALMGVNGGRRVANPIDFPHLDEFLETRGNRVHYAADTQRAYRSHLVPFLRRALRLGKTEPSQLMTSSDVAPLEQAMYEEGLAPNTIAAHMRHLRCFLRWCYDQRFLSGPPSFKIKKPRTQPQPVDPEDVSLILKAATETTQPERDRAILLVMASLGLRAGEVSRLTLEAYNGDVLYVSVGKTNADRFLPVPDTTRKAIDRWLKKRPRSSSDRLFLTDDGYPLTYYTIRRLVERLEKRSGVEFHAHKLRATFAINALDAGIPQAAVRDLMGHTTTAMTNHYASYNINRLKQYRNKLEIK